MDFCESLVANEELMTPPGAEGSLSLSGIPPEVIAAMAELAADRDLTLKEIYSEAATALIDAVRNGKAPHWESTLGGSNRKTFWVHPEVAREIDDLRKSVNRSRSVVMLTALKSFLIANGRTVNF
jgi:hypothetical protein